MVLSVGQAIAPEAAGVLLGLALMQAALIAA